LEMSKKTPLGFSGSKTGEKIEAKFVSYVNKI